MIAAIIAVCEALVALPKIGDKIESYFAAIVGWWVGRQQRATLAAIADAAAYAARAQNDEDRYKAAEKWRAALSNSRVTP